MTQIITSQVNPSNDCVLSEHVSLWLSRESAYGIVNDIIINFLYIVHTAQEILKMWAFSNRIGIFHTLNGF